MKRSQLLSFLLILLAFPVTGQKYGETKEDSVECIKRLNLYRDFRDGKEYQKALPHWQKAVEVCPKASKRLYLDGEDFYESFIEKTEDTAQKIEYVDSLMWVYDKRIEEYGEEMKVQGKKGSHLVKYRKFLPAERLVKGNELLAKSVHGLKKQSFPPHIGRYFFSLYFLYKMDSIGKEKIIEEYLPISHYIDQNIKNPRNQKYKQVYEEQIRPKIDKVLRVIADCEKLDTVYGGMLEKDSVAPHLKRQMMVAMKKRGCKENELYPRIAKSVHAEDPTAASAYEIGVIEMDNDNNEEAAEYLQEAIDLLKEGPGEASKDSGKVDSASAKLDTASEGIDEERLAEFYIAAGKNANERGLPQKANEYARNALELQEDHPRAYIIIAEAMALSSESCGDNKLGKGAVYWLASDYLDKARESAEAAKDSSLKKLIDQRMGSYRAEFPGQDAMFTHGQLKENGEPVDEPYEIGCWIGESTMPRKSW
jgi:tetratricopeptide (TPR) repeat protein